MKFVDAVREVRRHTATLTAWRDKHGAWPADDADFLAKDTTNPRELAEIKARLIGEKSTPQMRLVVDAMIARHKLAALGVHIDELTEVQAKYLASWDQGT